MSKCMQLAVISFFTIVPLGDCHANAPEKGSDAITLIAKYNQQGRHDDAIKVANDPLKRHPEDSGATFYEQIAITYLVKASFLARR